MPELRLKESRNISASSGKKQKTFMPVQFACLEALLKYHRYGHWYGVHNSDCTMKPETLCTDFPFKNKDANSDANDLTFNEFILVTKIWYFQAIS